MARNAVYEKMRENRGFWGIPGFTREEAVQLAFASESGTPCLNSDAQSFLKSVPQFKRKYGRHRCSF